MKKQNDKAMTKQWKKKKIKYVWKKINQNIKINVSWNYDICFCVMVLGNAFHFLVIKMCSVQFNSNYCEICETVESQTVLFEKF